LDTLNNVAIKKEGLDECEKSLRFTLNCKGITIDKVFDIFSFICFVVIMFQESLYLKSKKYEMILTVKSKPFFLRFFYQTNQRKVFESFNGFFVKQQQHQFKANAQ